MKDPFTREGGFMVIGGRCSLCHTEVCCNQVCYQVMMMIKLHLNTLTPSAFADFQEGRDDKKYTIVTFTY
jgi:hypothetical protein